MLPLEDTPALDPLTSVILVPLGPAVMPAS